jgi:hypothetical protein
MFDSIPQISIGSAALIIFILCIGFVLLRGLTRMILSSLVIAGSAWVAFRVWQLAPGWSIDLIGKPVPWIVTGLPILAFLVTFIIARVLLGFLVRPFTSSKDGQPRSPQRLLVQAIFTLIPAALIWFTGATLVHHAGSIAEIQATADDRKIPDDSSFGATIQRLKTGIAEIIPADWLEKIDPLADPSRVALVKLITTQADSDLKPVINPETGAPYPRALIVQDPELQNLARTGRFEALLKHPLFQKAMDDPKVQQAIQSAF